eukprot:6858839-Prymnesium_polylepis.1
MIGDDYDIDDDAGFNVISPDNKADDDYEEAGFTIVQANLTPRKSTENRSCAAAVLFKLCLVLGTVFPVAVVLITLRAIAQMVTGTDTGSDVWSPPGSTEVPAVVTLAIVATALVGGGAYLLRSACIAARKKRALALAAHAKPRARQSDPDEIIE